MTVGQLISFLRTLPPGKLVAVDLMGERPIGAPYINGRDYCIVPLVPLPDRDPPPWVQATNIGQAKWFMQEAHRALHDDDIRRAHHALHCSNSSVAWHTNDGRVTSESPEGL